MCRSPGRRSPTANGPRASWTGADRMGAGSTGLGSAGLGSAGLGSAGLGSARLGSGRLGWGGLGWGGWGGGGARGRPGVAGRADLREVELSRLEFAVVDLETTGWSPEVAAITEIGAVRVRGGQRQGGFASLVNPGMPVPPGIEDLTGITDSMLTAAPRLAAVLPGLLDFA